MFAQKIFAISSFHMNKLNEEKTSYKSIFFLHQGYGLPSGKQAAHDLEHRSYVMGVWHLFIRSMRSCYKVLSSGREKKNNAHKSINSVWPEV